MSLNIAVNHSSSSKVSAFNANGNTLMWAMICSILLHALLAIVIPNIQFDPIKKPDLLIVELTKKTEPPPVVVPEPVKVEPEPIKPKVDNKPEPKTVTKPLPTPTVVKHESNPTPPPTAAAPPQTEVIAVAPKTEAAPSPTVPAPAPVVAPEPPKPLGPSQEDIDAARGKYGSTLWGAIAKYKQYPRIAQMKGWQGEAIVELLLDGNGKLKSKKILQSSGYESLDKQALEMVEKAAPFPAPPEALRGSNFSIKVPVPFKLEDQ